MSDFSDVDRSLGVQRLVEYLNETDRGLAAIKAYMTAAAKRAVDGGFVLDVGCGVGHDLARLASAGLRPVGVDASENMLVQCRENVLDRACLVRADAASMPFRDAAFDGCRVERVFQHVGDPDCVIDELARVLRPGGFVAVFEPDYSVFRVETAIDAASEVPACLLRVRHPNIGGTLVPLLEERGFRVEDVVTESSRGYRFDQLPIDAEVVVNRAVVDGRFDALTAKRWIDEQRERTANGTFQARWDKILVIAHRTR